MFAAVLLALVGGLLLWQNSDTEESEAQEAQVEERQVLVAARDIEAGESASMLSENAYAFVKVQSVPVDQVQPGALTSVEDLADLALGRNVASSTIRSDVQITFGDFFVPGQQQVSALPDVDENIFEITVALEPQRAFGGNLRSGMTVAVIGSFDPSGESPAETVVLLESALVTNVQSEQLFSQEQLTSDPLAPSLAPTSRLFVTFGVPVDDLERLTFGTEFGRIWLARQGPDATVDDSEVRDRESVVVSLVDDGDDDSAEDSPASAADTAAEDPGDEAG
jgi:pilus assembly protein CpaB